MLLYVDPGGGSYLVQILIAAILSAAFYFKAGWNYIKSIFKRKKDDIT
ncbi:MAG: hypothetical protein ACK5OP_08790 [Sphingobacteriales bacterium]|jgi:hypothetical protein